MELIAFGGILGTDAAASGGDARYKKHSSLHVRTHARGQCPGVQGGFIRPAGDTVKPPHDQIVLASNE